MLCELRAMIQWHQYATELIETWEDLSVNVASFQSGETPYIPLAFIDDYVGDRAHEIWVGRYIICQIFISFSSVLNVSSQMVLSRQKFLWLCML